MRFHKILCGHCTNINNEKIKPILCEFWEFIELKDEDRKKSIIEIWILWQLA